MNPLEQFDNGQGSATDLLKFQFLANSSLIISATRKCPLSCSHCITSSSPDAAGPLLDIELAKIWAHDFPALVSNGLKSISFTGGEPILALDAIAFLAKQSRAHSIRPSIVTSCVWASTLKAARKVVSRVGSGISWDLGVDGWHADQMPISRVDNALTAITENGDSATVRFCDSDSYEDSKDAAAVVAGIVNGRAPIMRQSVRSIGRAASENSKIFPTQPGLPKRPCVSTGLFVRADGTTGPCCAGLSYEAVGRHPFDYGTLNQHGDLLKAWSRWHSDNLLKVMRLATLASIEGWFPENSIPINAMSQDPCESCVRLWSNLDPSDAESIRARADTEVVSAKIVELETELLNQLDSMVNDPIA